MIEHKQYYRKGGTYELPIEIYNDLIGQIEEAQHERNDYKSRCKKANKFIDNNSHYYSTIKHNEGFSIDLDEEVFCNTLLNILNGSDNK